MFSRYPSSNTLRHRLQTMAGTQRQSETVPSIRFRSYQFSCTHGLILSHLHISLILALLCVALAHTHTCHSDPCSHHSCLDSPPCMHVLHLNSCSRRSCLNSPAHMHFIWIFCLDIIIPVSILLHAHAHFTWMFTHMALSSVS